MTRHHVWSQPVNQTLGVVIADYITVVARCIVSAQYHVTVTRVMSQIVIVGRMEVG